MILYQSLTRHTKISYAQRVRYFKKSLLTVIVVFFSIVLFFGFTEGLYYLFLFPTLALTFFVCFYLYRQNEKDDEETIKQSLQYAEEDAEAEKWIQHSLAPQTLVHIKANRWQVITYGALLFLGVTFMWSYLSNGLILALRNMSYAGGLFGLFVIYLLAMPYVFVEIHKVLPKKLQKYANGDWERGYMFLLPITFLIYLLYPFTSITAEIFTKATTFPLFFFIYSSFFICVYCITYMYQDIRREEEKRLKKSVKEMLQEK